MAYAPGKLPASALAAVQTGVKLATATAVRYLLLKAAAKAQLGRTISIALPYGGYRTAAVQNGMHHAGSAVGTAAERRAYGLSTVSTVAIASDPYGTHEPGTRVDIVGTPMDAKFLALAKSFGFILEFPGSDPNHFKDLGTYKVSTAKKIAVKAAAVVTSKKVYYAVKAGDTLTRIAALYSDPRNKKADLTVAELEKLNPGIVPTKLKIGQRVRVA